LIPALLALVAPHTAGDPMTPTKWLNCRLTDLQERLAQQGHPASLPTLSRLLKAADYRLRANRKQLAEANHPDRDIQFSYIRQQRTAHLDAGQPVISVDSKKKELIGAFKNNGQAWSQVAELVNVHDFPSAAVGRAVPYGIYDLLRNVGVVYVGQSADTPEFAVDNIAAWCAMNLPRYYPQATRLLIEADGGGSNSARAQVWKVRLQERVVARFGLCVTVCHYPPGTSKWNPIEHRLFSEISKTWAGCPLTSWEVLLGYIRDTTTQTGLRVEAHLVPTIYTTGIKVTPAEWALLQMEVHSTCPRWNYTIRP
jgi:hypothetical protein